MDPQAILPESGLSCPWAGQPGHDHCPQLDGAALPLPVLTLLSWGCPIQAVVQTFAVAGMPGPKPPAVILSEAARRELERLVCAHKTPQAVVRRARVVLLAALGSTNLEIARQVPMDEEAVGLWRRRWAAMQSVPLDELSVAERLAEAPRPGAVPRVSAEQVCQIVALACEQPGDAGRPISHWSHRELADEIIRRGITDRISPRHAARLLKSGRPATPSRSVLAHPSR